MAENIAQAHRREGHTYSAFHQGLTEANEGKAYALGHIYTKENVRHLLQKKKLVGEKLAKNYFLGNGYSLNSEKETLLDVLIENVVKFCYNHLTNASGLGDNVRHDLEKGKKQAKEAARFIKTKKRPVGDR